MSFIEKKEHQATREKILRYLLFHRSNPDITKFCTAKEIAKNLNISPNGVRHHLKQLEYEKLVKRDVRRGRTGRPATIYTFEKKAFNEFPKMYPEVAKYLLEGIIQKYGDDAAINLLEDIGKKIASELKELTDINHEESSGGVSLEQRIEVIRQMFENFGKFPELVEEKDFYLIRNYNCLVYDVVIDNPIVCRIDETLIKELLGFKPIKESCIRDGGGYCQFKVKKEQAV